MLVLIGCGYRYVHTQLCLSSELGKYLVVQARSLGWNSVWLVVFRLACLPIQTCGSSAVCVFLPNIFSTVIYRDLSTRIVLLGKKKELGI